MNKQQLAAKIWESANQMRSKIEANEYKDYILGFIFYKYLSDKEVKFLKENDYSDDDIRELINEDVTPERLKFICGNIGYFISYQDLFSTWISMGQDFEASNVTDALHAFSSNIMPTHKKVFEGVFDTLQTGLSKLGDTSGSRTKAVSELIHLIKDIPMDGRQDYDVLGFIYEYLISMFAANAGKKAGEFYTPHEVALLMSEIVADHLKERETIEIYDPTSGSGSLLINIGRCAAKHIANKNNIKYYAQELKQNTYNLTRMNLVMRGILPANIVTRNGDTLEEDWPYFDENDPIKTYNPLYVDAVVSNPPYSQKWDSSNKETDARYARFGLAPKGKADYAFLLHDLFHIKPNGIMTIVLPHGVLFRGGEEGQIRKNLIEANHIDAIIGLPANIFFGTGIPTIIMVLKQKRDNTDVLIVDASKGFDKVGKNNRLRASDIKKIVDTVTGRLDVYKYSRKVKREEIRNNDYNLNIPRYVDSSEKAESWDIYASMFGGIPEKEIAELKEFWAAFPELKEALFEKKSEQYAQVKVDNIKKTILEHKEVKAFIENFNSSFDSFDKMLRKRLLEGMETVNVSKEEAVLSDEIFQRLESIPMIDKYVAYQLLDDEWIKIAVDLEIIQTEGFETTKRVDPNLVIKKKNGKDQEIQDGWLGHVLPFELVQKHLLKEDLDALRQKENRIVEINSSYEEILDSLSEEEKEGSTVNDGGDAFVAAEVSKEAKVLQTEVKKNGAFDGESYEAKILVVNSMLAEEKILKSEIKEKTAELHILTKETIEALTDEQVHDLLEVKWIEPIVKSLKNLPEMLIDVLSAEIQSLSEKYTTTYSKIERQICETENTLAAMMDELVGDKFDMQGLNELKSLLGGGRIG